MDKVIKARWVNALKSGNYKQGIEKLRTKDDDGGMIYCCLGVLCDIAFRDEPGLFPTGWEEQEREDKNESELFPIRAVWKWAGMEQCDQGDFNIPAPGGGPTIRGTLSELNDKGATFEQIADCIEEKL